MNNLLVIKICKKTFKRSQQIPKKNLAPFKKIFISAIFCTLPLVGFSAPNVWSKIESPRPLPLEIYGSASNGCIMGASQLPPRGVGYQTMRQSRNRHYGHPILIQFINTMGQFSQHHSRLLLLGDMSQAMGGPMSSDHASHQTGLDIDIWLYEATSNQFTTNNIETLQMQSTVNKITGQVNSYWKPIFNDYIKAAATHPNVERIFVNPVIKQTLCNINPNQTWLQKVRPWWGHDSHFHVRLKCPPNETHCQNPQPIPSGNGCDMDLKNWILDQSNAILKPKSKSTQNTAKAIKKTHKIKPPLPIECQKLI